MNVRLHELWRHIGFFLTLSIMSFCVGLLVNQFRDKPLPLIYQTREERLQESVQKLAEERKAPKPRNVESLSEVLSLEEFADFVENKRGLVLDARPEVFHRLGHVPGALSLPRDDFDNAYSKLKERLENNRSQPLAIYCSSVSCEDAGLLKKALTILGFTEPKIFEGGWAEWTSAGKPREIN